MSAFSSLARLSQLLLGRLDGFAPLVSSTTSLGGHQQPAPQNITFFFYFSPVQVYFKFFGQCFEKFLDATASSEMSFFRTLRDADQNTFIPFILIQKQNFG